MDRVGEGREASRARRRETGGRGRGGGIQGREGVTVTAGCAACSCARCDWNGMESAEEVWVRK